LLVSRLD